MTPEPSKPQAALEQLADLTQTLEKEKVQLTLEVEGYVREHIRAVQNKLQAGEDVYESDLAFIEKVKMWVRMPKEWREKYKSVEEMMKSEEMKDVTMSDVYEANKRNISVTQWLDLLHIAEAAGKKKEWIDETFIFPGAGKIGTEGDLNFQNYTGLTKLPDNLSISGNLVLRGCTGLTVLPDNLSVSGGLYLKGCTGLTKLPDNLSVGRGLSLDGCTGLTVLPDNLSVGGHLSLEGCTGLTMLPDDLSVGEDIYLSENLNSRVKEDAERLKLEGKIGGEIEYTR